MSLLRFCFICENYVIDWDCEHFAAVTEEERHAYGETMLGLRHLGNGRSVIVYDMLYTIRVCTMSTGDLLGYDDAWCYPKLAREPITKALTEWDGNGDPPVGWIKQVGTGRRRTDGDPIKEFVSP